ncbi:hypothetical protein PFFCH_02509 [Plasmodium falciparum FCH/4]|uniref:Uncharacterized protein n=1 Tax=Plasmodium falciparum FCH/4 TaxID=1036724 RepID=A0A024VP47_PLAFA|nr:hypothetical protein PFFCH_02509 [Plasmodium falciparum FCH/4]
MACINEGNSITPRVKFKTIRKINDQKYMSEQAYLVPENDGTAVYISYELNKTLERIFQRYSTNGNMNVNEFVKMYKHFFQVLERLSAFLFRKLIMTEQEKFNVLIKHLTCQKIVHEKATKERYSVGIQTHMKKECKGTNAVCDMRDKCCGTFVEVKDRGTMTEMDDVNYYDKKEDIKKNIDILKDNIIYNDHNDDLNNTLNDGDNHNANILKSHASSKQYTNKMNSINSDDITNKLKEEISNALKIIDDKNMEIENIYKKNLEQIEIEREKINQLQEEIKKLQNEKNDLIKKQENKKINDKDIKNNDELNTNKLEQKESIVLRLKRLLILSGEQEAELIRIFSIYSIYCGGIAEYVMNKRLCANFLTTFYLLKKNGKNKNKMALDVKDAERLFNEVSYKRESLEKVDIDEEGLTYFYFKLFLNNIGKFFYPELTERESFLEIVLNYVLNLNKNGGVKKWKDMNEQIKKKNKMRITYDSNDLHTFDEKMVGGYTSSEKSIKHHNLEKIKTLIKNNSHMKSEQKILNDNLTTDLSFEYLESNSAKKKEKNKINGKSINARRIINVEKNTNMEKNIYVDKRKKMKKKKKFINIPNYLNEYEIYDKQNIYEVNNELIDSLKSIPEDKYHYFKTLKPTRTKFSTFKKDSNESLYDILPLYDIQGKVWPSKMNPKKKSIPQFGME